MVIRNLRSIPFTLQRVSSSASVVRIVQSALRTFCPVPHQRSIMSTHHVKAFHCFPPLLSSRSTTGDKRARRVQPFSQYASPHRYMVHYMT